VKYEPIAIVELFRTHPGQETLGGQAASAGCLPRGTVSQIGDTSLGLRTNGMLLDPYRPGRVRGSAPGAKPLVVTTATNRVEARAGMTLPPGT
jgi:hypothetical protein